MITRLPPQAVAERFYAARLEACAEGAWEMRRVFTKAQAGRDWPTMFPWGTTTPEERAPWTEQVRRILDGQDAHALHVYEALFGEGSWRSAGADEKAAARLLVFNVRSLAEALHDAEAWKEVSR